MKITRIEWDEIRKEYGAKEMYYIIVAEFFDGDWKFYERSSWDIEWVEIPATLIRLKRAISESEKQPQESTGSAKKRDVLGKWNHPYPPPKHH